jgi:capsular polysaccharide biosynthesis protein
MLNRLTNLISNFFRPNKFTSTVLIFGASKGGESVYRAIQSQHNVIGFIDNNTKVQGTKLFRQRVYPPNKLRELSFDNIIIASDYHHEIKKQLINEFQINSDKIVIFKLAEAKKPTFIFRFFEYIDQSMIYFLCNTPFVVAQYLSTFLSFTTEKYNSISLKKITWLDQLEAHKIKTFHPEKNNLSYAPNFIDEKERSSSTIVPEVSLYHFKNGMIMTSVNAIVFGDNEIAIGRVPRFPLDKSQYAGGFLFSHGKKNAQIKEYQLEKIEKGIAIVGSNDRNYYHWVIEVLSKFQFIIDLPKEYDDFPILISEQALKIDSIQEYISYFGINREIVYLQSCIQYQVEELLFISSPNYFVANLRVGQQWTADSNFVRADSLKYLRDSVFSVLEKSEQTVTPKRVFLARKGIIRDYNQAEVFDLLCQYGFEAVYLEDLSLLQQVKLMTKAEVIIGPTGAAWTNLIFCNSGTKALCWMVEELGDFSCFSNLAQFSGVNMEYLQYKVASRNTRTIYYANYIIDINKIKQWLIAKDINKVSNN